MENSIFSWKTPMNEEESFLFDAQPTLYYQFYNSYLMSEKKHQQAAYAFFKTHIRMYQETSLPIKTPSYIGFIGYQYSFNWGKNQFNLAAETGHYSNGQSNCAWDPSFKDGSPACEAAFTAINDETNLADLLNRSSGNFSTNTTKLMLQFVLPRINNTDSSGFDIAHRLSFSYSRNHEAFAYLFNVSNGQGDIQFIGDQSFAFSTESFFSLDANIDLSIKNDVEYIHGVHPSINPWRYSLTVNVFPADWVTAFFVSYTTGHDNYNYRIVDSRNQFSVGVSWDLFDRQQYQ